MVLEFPQFHWGTVFGGQIPDDSQSTALRGPPFSRERRCHDLSRPRTLLQRSSAAWAGMWPSQLAGARFRRSWPSESTAQRCLRKSFAEFACRRTAGSACGLEPWKERERDFGCFGPRSVAAAQKVQSAQNRRCQEVKFPPRRYGLIGGGVRHPPTRCGPSSAQ